jgi:hypothetical protein
MKAKDIFCLIIRLVGLIFLYQGLAAFPQATLVFWNGLPHQWFRYSYSAIMMVGWPLAVGIWMVRGAPWLVRLAYEETLEPPTTQNKV